MAIDYEHECCFARPDLHSKKNGINCAILTEVMCRTRGRCPFFKTKQQAKESAEASYKRAVKRGYYTGGGGYEPLA